MDVQEPTTAADETTRRLAVGIGGAVAIGAVGGYALGAAGTQATDRVGTAYSTDAQIAVRFVTVPVSTEGLETEQTVTVLCVLALGLALSAAARATSARSRRRCPRARLAARARPDLRLVTW